MATDHGSFELCCTSPAAMAVTQQSQALLGARRDRQNPNPVPQHPRPEAKHTLDDPAELPDRFEMSFPVKLVVAVAIGCLVGALLFVELYFRYKVVDWVAAAAAGVLAAVVTLLSFICTAIRCVALLLIPTLATGKGKSALSALLISALLAGPGANIGYNFDQTAESMNCFDQLVRNQSRLWLQQSKTLVRQMRATLQPTLERVGSVRETVEDALTVWSARVLPAMRNCESDLEDLDNRCRTSLTQTKNDCNNKVSSLTSVDEAVEEICNIFSVEGVCDVLKPPGGVCAAVPDISNIAAVFQDFPAAFSMISDEFALPANYTAALDTYLNSEPDVHQVKRNMSTSIRSRFEHVSRTFATLQSVLQFSIVLVLFSAWLYYYRFQHSLTHDNIYKTRHLVEYDGQSHSNLFPLKGSEEKWLIDCRKLTLAASERQALSSSLLFYFVTVVLAVGLFAFDWAFYVMLDVIHRNGQNSLGIGLDADLSFSSEGTGFPSRLFNSLFQIDVIQNFGSTFNTTRCLPEPRPLGSGHVTTAAVLLIVLALAVVLQAYARRLRFVIVGFNSPRRRQQRVAFLHHKMLNKRQRYQTSLPLKVAIRQLQNQDVEKCRHRWMRCSRFLAVAQFLGFFRRVCVVCERRESGTRSTSKSVTCSAFNGGQKCGAFYCRTCFEDDLQGKCALCDGN